ncbi:MAG: invasin domain 3-containing protein, partial [Longimicrobiaceae bacterium]
MPRNLNRLVLLLGAAFLAAAPALHAQQTGAPVRGDVDGDGRVTAADARIVSDYLVGKAVPAGANVRERGDVNGDGRVTAVDAAIIARAAAGRDMSRFPVGTTPGDALAVLECTGDVRTSAVECHAPGASSGGARGDIIVGGQNLNVKLTSANNALVAPDTFQFTVTVQNLLHQAMAADSGTGAANVTGVRVFFASGPSVTGGPAGPKSISVANADGMGTYTGTNQRYFQYSGAALGPDGILSPGETSQPRTWKLQYTGAPTYSFLLFLSTPMKYPKGWVDIYPPNNHYSSPDSVFADTVVAGRTLQLQDSVRNPFGGYIPGAPVTWSNPTAPPLVTVNASGLVSTPVGASGVDSITATNGPRSGTVAIVVTPPTGANSVISALPLTIAAGDSSLVTVQVKDGFGRNVTTGGDAVTLTTSLGTLRGTGAAGPTINNPVDSLNGKYTAWLKSTTTGTANLTGTVLGNAIGTTASVTITPAAPANISVTSTNPQNGTVGAAVASVPTVHVTDTYGNAVGAGIPVTFAVTGGGGSLTGASTSTDASGNAALGSWTLGSTAPGPNALSATVTGGSNPSTSFTAFVPAFVVTDSSQAMGNTTLSSSVAPNALTNDFSINGAGGVSIKPAFIGALTTARTGTLTLAADGSFSYLPPAGNVLRDSVSYEIQDTHYTGPAAASGYIKLRFVGKVWYVDNTNGGAADGRDVSPFTSVGAAATAAGATDSILVRTGSGTTTGGTLKAAQLVYGQGASSAFTTTLNGSSVTLLSAGSAPSIGALTLGTGGTGNTLRGFTSSGGITGPSGFGTLTVSEVGINSGSAQALSLTNGTLSGGFTALVSSGGTNNVLLSSVSTSGTSTLGASGNALSGATGDGVVVSGGSGSFTFPGNVSNA